MKATGIVRRIDDLGRVVIPKEIRRTMRIREGDPLEIYTDREGEVIFKKYSPIGELNSFAAQYAETLHKICGMAVVICDRDVVIACAGLPRKDYLEKKLSSELDEIIEGRAPYHFLPGSNEVHVTGDSQSASISCAVPIIADSDLIGCVASVGLPESEPLDGDVETKLISTAAAFLAKQLEV